MPPPKQNRVKLRVDEGSSAQQSDEPSLKSRSLTSNVRNRPLMPPKYGNLASFPSHSFDFHEILNVQGVEDLISDNGSVYPNLVKEFFDNFSIAPDYVMGK